MARMLPPEPVRSVSAAEVEIFSLIRKQLNDEWTALHSLGVASHEWKPWAEIDFVLVGPPGVFCLEVKGGRVGRTSEGIYTFTNRHGHVNKKKEGPFEQVGGASAALFNHLVGRPEDLGIARSMVAYGVVVPDMQIDDAVGIDWEPALVYDARDRERPFEAYMTRLTTASCDRLKQKLGRRPQSLSAKRREAIVNVLRGPFPAVYSLRAAARRVHRDLSALTQEQVRAIEGLAGNERLVVRGSAGTGKTLLALADATRAANAGRRVLLLCFNRRLAQSLAETVTHPAVEVRDLQSFMLEQIRAAGLDEDAHDAGEVDRVQVIYPGLCRKALQQLGRAAGWDVLVVDEAQDVLQGECLALFDAILKGGLAAGRWRLFLDPWQDVYGNRQTGQLKKLLGYGAASFDLSINCRNTAAIANCTSLLSGRRPPTCFKVEGVVPTADFYDSAAAMRKIVGAYVTELLSGKMRPEDIVVLSTQPFASTGLAGGIPGVSETIAETQDISAGVIRYSTVADFKGLEADAVVVIDIRRLDTDVDATNAYVATSRARAFLCVAMRESARPSYAQAATEYATRLLSKDARTP